MEVGCPAGLEGKAPFNELHVNSLCIDVNNFFVLFFFF